MDIQEFLLVLLINFSLLFSHSSAFRVSHGIPQNEMGGSVIQLMGGGSFATINPTRVTQLSWNPRVFLHREFLSEEECDHLINLAKDKLKKSMVVNESGKSVESEFRTSSGMFVARGQDDTIARIEARIAAWTFLPVENGESTQILHYEIGQKYAPHFDYFPGNLNQMHVGGPRLATVIMYLSDVEEGGETVFPDSKGAHMTQSKRHKLSYCAKNGFAVNAKKGNALLFFNFHPNLTTDPMSVHESCPVMKGQKWSATKWIHVKSLNILDRYMTHAQ